MIGTVTAQRLNVRDRPGAEGRKLGAIPSGTVVDILGLHRGWFEIRFQQAPAFLYGDYVRIEENERPQTGVVTAGMLNVRDRPSTTGAILGRLVQGSIIEVSSRSEDWLEVSFQDGNGFVSRSYVDLHVRESPNTGAVVAGVLNVRARPLADAAIVGQLTRGARIEIVTTLGSWHEILFNSGTGFVAAGYVEIDKEVDPSPTPVLLNEVGVEEPAPSAARLDPAEPLIPTRTLPVAGSPQERKVASTWNRFGGLLEDLSRRRQIDVACAVAVLCVESSGKGFEPSNRDRVIIRFENHKFWKYWGRRDPDLYRRHFQYRKGQAWKDHTWRSDQEQEWRRFHGNQRSEWEVLDFARAIDDDAALMSISMGAPQIMGFHFQAIGYQSVQEMFQAFGEEMSAHIQGLFDFMSTAMVHHLQVLNFSEFAGMYNGSGQKERYGRWIDDHYRAFKRLT